jgi:hypothetical protein
MEFASKAVHLPNCLLASSSLHGMPLSIRPNNIMLVVISRLPLTFSFYIHVLNLTYNFTIKKLEKVKSILLLNVQGEINPQNQLKVQIYRSFLAFHMVLTLRTEYFQLHNAFSNRLSNTFYALTNHQPNT